MANSKRLYTPKGRLAFAAISRAKKNQRNEDRYGGALLFRVADFTPEEKTLWSAIQEEVRAQSASLGKGKPPRSPFKSGADQVRDDGSFWDGFDEDVIFADFWTKFSATDPDHPLTLVDLDGADVDPRDFYSGCFCRAKFHAYTYVESGNRGVAFGLDGLQWLGEGERFGGGGRGFGDAPPVAGASRPARRTPSETGAPVAGSAPEEQPPERGYQGEDAGGEDMPF